jgi:hypothetical protein
MKPCKTSFNKGDLIIYDGPRKPVGEDVRCFGRIRWMNATNTCLYFTIVWLTPDGWDSEETIRSFCRRPNEEELALFTTAGLIDYPSLSDNWKRR